MRAVLGAAIAAFVFAAAASSASADPTLVGQWHLDEGSGTVASDSSGNGNDGAVLGGASWVSGRLGSALRFDGPAAVVDIPDSPVLEPPSAVTVSAWVEQTGTPGAYRYIVAKGEVGCHSASYGLYTGSNGGLAFYVYNGYGDSYVISPNAGTSVWDGAWHLVVGTYDGTAVHLFVDGNEVGSGTPRWGPIAYPSADSKDLFIGGYPIAETIGGCPAGSFLGVIDEVNLWSRALSSQDVSSMMPQTAGGPPADGQTPPGGSGSTGGQTPPGGSGSTGGQTPPGGSGSTGGETPPGGSGSTPGSESGAGHYHPPQIRRFKVSLATASIARAGGGKATVTYTLTQAAHVTFKGLLDLPGTVRAGRCVKTSSKGTGRANHEHCVRLVTLARFFSTGHAGINRLRITASLWRKLTPGHYLLAATPSANGQTGTTVTAAFAVPH